LVLSYSCSSLPFYLTLPLFCLLLAFTVFLFLDDLLKLFFAFLVFLVCFIGSRIQTSNFVLFIINELIKGEIEKSSGQFLDLIVMSH
jgi:hypothetical protein